MDSESGLVHTVQVTAANVHDVCATADLLTGEEEQVYGDSGYLGAEKRPEARKKNTAGKKIRYKINRRPSQSKNNSARSQAQIKRREHEKSSVRAKVEHVFAVLKLQLRIVPWGEWISLIRLYYYKGERGKANCKSEYPARVGKSDPR